MSNNYGSVVVQRVFRNVFESTIAPTADFTIPSGSKDYKFADPCEVDPDPQSNIFIRRIGLFCNFADGLVFKNPAPRIGMDFLVSTFKEETMSGGEINFTAGSKAITGVGTDFSGESVGFLKTTIGDNHLMIVDPTDATNANIDNYSYLDGAKTIGLEVQRLSIGTSDVTDVWGLPTLNTLYDVGRLLSPSLVSSSPDTFSDLGFRARLNMNNLDLTFLTKSIATSFSGDAIHFDIVAELEYTRKS